MQHVFLLDFHKLLTRFAVSYDNRVIICSINQAISYLLGIFYIVKLFVQYLISSKENILQAKNFLVCFLFVKQKAAFEQADGG